MNCLRKENNIWIIKVQEEFCSVDEKKIKEVFNKLFDIKNDHGNLFSLRKEQNNNALLDSAKIIELGFDGNIKHVVGVCKAKDLKKKKKLV